MAVSGNGGVGISNVDPGTVAVLSSTVAGNVGRGIIDAVQALPLAAGT